MEIRRSRQGWRERNGEMMRGVRRNKRMLIRTDGRVEEKEE